MNGTWGVGGVRCRIKLGWDRSGTEGDAICYFDTEERPTQLWVVVHWDGEDDPDLHKAAGLQIKHIGEDWTNKVRG